MKLRSQHPASTLTRSPQIGGRIVLTPQDKADIKAFLRLLRGSSRVLGQRLAPGERPRHEVAAFAADRDNAPAWYVNVKRVEWQTPPPAAPAPRGLRGGVPRPPRIHL